MPGQAVSRSTRPVEVFMFALLLASFLNSGNRAIDGQANEQTGVPWFNEEIANITTLNWRQAT